MYSTRWTKADQRTFFPRCHQLVELGERRTFAIDFRRTAAATVLRLHCSFNCPDLLPHLVCAPQLVTIALRAVEEWTLDLAHCLPSAMHEGPHMTSGGGNMIGENECSGATEGVLDFASDGIAAWQWAELLEYSYALANVADAAEIYQHEAQLPSIVESSKQRKIAQSELREAEDKFTAHCVQNGVEPEGKKNVPFDDTGMTSSRLPVKSDTIPTAKLRQLWTDLVPFASLVLNDAPSKNSDRVQIATAVGAPGHALCSRALARLTALWPQAGIDGISSAGELPRNVWIVKAPSASRGAGIELERRLKHIIARSGGMGGRVAQKYIENPLLTPTTILPPMHTSQGAVLQECSIPRPLTSRRNGIKFDLRMWVLLVGASRSPGHVERDLPSECYIFEPCYARRCSHTFSLAANSFKDHLAHLSNYSIQKKDLANEDDTGADDLLWTEEELLSASGAESTLNKSNWESRVKPSLRRLAATLAATILPAWSDESLGGRAQCFELVGLDVMLDDHLSPWLLEANMTPGLSRRDDANPTHCKRIARMLRGIVHITTSRGFGCDASTGTNKISSEENHRASDGDWLKVYSAPITNSSDSTESRDAQREAKTNADTLCVTGKQLAKGEISAHEDIASRRHGISTLANLGVPKMISRWRHKKMRLASAATSIQCFYRCIRALMRAQHLRNLRAACFIQQFSRATIARYYAKRELQSLREQRASVRIQSARRRRLAQQHTKYCQLTRAWFTSIDKCRQRLACAKWLAFAAYVTAATRAASTLQSHVRPYLQRCRYLAFVARQRKRLREVGAANLIRAHFRAHRRDVLQKQSRFNAASALQRFCLGLPGAKQRQRQLRYLLAEQNHSAANVLQGWWRQQQTSKLRKLATEKNVASKATIPFRLGAPVITTRSFANNGGGDSMNAMLASPQFAAAKPHDNSPSSLGKTPLALSLTEATSNEPPPKENFEHENKFVPRAFGPCSRYQEGPVDSVNVESEKRATCNPQPAVILLQGGKIKPKKHGSTDHSETRLDKLAAPKNATNGKGKQNRRKESTGITARATEDSRSGQHNGNASSAPKSRREKLTSVQSGAKSTVVEGKSRPSNQSGFESAHSMLPQDIRDLLSYARARRQQRAATTSAIDPLESRDISRSNVGIDNKGIPDVGVPSEIPLPPPSPLSSKPLSGHRSHIGLSSESPAPPPPHQHANEATEAATRSTNNNNNNNNENGDSGCSGATITLDWLDQMQRRRKSGKKVRNLSYVTDPSFLSRQNTTGTGGVLHSAAEQFLG